MSFILTALVALSLVSFSTPASADVGEQVLIRDMVYEYNDWIALTQGQQEAIVLNCNSVPSSNPGDCDPVFNNASNTPTYPGEYSASNATPPWYGQAANAVAGTVQFATGPKTIAGTLFEQSLGAESNSCLSCDFLSFFMLALSDFSYMVYTYFHNMFMVMAPIFLTVWLGYRAAKLMIMGGEDGKDFLYGVVGKLAIFSFLWIIAIGATQRDNAFLWRMTGPDYLSYAFRLSNEIRVHAINAGSRQDGSGIVEGADSNTSRVMLCHNVQSSAVNYAGQDPKYIFIQPAVEAGCFTERAHILGIATGAALAFDSFGGASFGWNEIGAWISWMLTAALKALIGLFIALTYAISAIWLIFLTLDIVTRGLITAAFSPVLMILYVYKPTRSVTVRALTAMAGAMVTAVALAMISTMAYVLITNTAKVYEATKGPIVTAYDQWDNDEVPNASGAEAMPDPDTDRIGAMRAFIDFVGVSDSDATRIPMDFGTPWFWYMAFCGVAIFALGKKIIKMLEDAVGYQGASEFANSALKATKMSAMGAIAGTAVMAPIAGAGAILGGKGAALAAGQSAGALGSAGRGIGAGLQWAGSKVGHKNVLSASAMGLRAMQNSRPGEE
jgi:hypothetical protein